MFFGINFDFLEMKNILYHEKNSIYEWDDNEYVYFNMCIIYIHILITLFYQEITKFLNAKNIAREEKMFTN